MKMPPKDKLFAHKGKVKPFAFNQAVAEVFDDMVSRSVPYYHQIQSSVLQICQKMIKKPKRIIDLGCSTGNLLFFLAQNLNDTKISYLGIDKSESMIAKAQEKFNAQRLKGKIEFVCEDILETDLKGADLVVINYVLQFLSPEQRLSFLKKVHKQLKASAVLIVSEKLQSSSKVLNPLFVKVYEEFKESNHYSKLEISQKRKALENVLVPFSLEENLVLVKKAGFKSVEPFFVWYNFASLVAVKG